MTVIKRARRKKALSDDRLNNTRPKGSYDYDEPKDRFNFSITTTAHDGLKKIAKDRGLKSVSKLIEDIGRQDIQLPP